MFIIFADIYTHTIGSAKIIFYNSCYAILGIKAMCHKIHICVHYCFLSGDDRSIVTYNGEVCPICLGVPKIGVRAPCGHSLCAECLANYCDVRIAPAPPPCPLCRAPLNSVALACDFVSIMCFHHFHQFR